MKRKPLILIVDDNIAGQKSLESMLLGKNYQLEFASNGPTAIEMAKNLKPDVILLDVMMPVMDGFEVCQHIRANEDTAEVPIIMVTALDDHDSKLIGLKAGADDFISKPVNRTELQARVKTITRLNRYHSLLEERKKLQQLSQKILEVQESERRSIAIELHDEIGQELTGLKFILNQLQTQRDTEVESKKVAIAIDLISQLIDKVRNLSLNLRPSMLDDFGLYPALTWLIDQISQNTNLKIVYNFSSQDEERYPPEIETATFRIAQEALTNIVRHAQATKVWITIESEANYLIFQIRDNGVGFDENSFASATPQYSTGLSGMHERVRMTGGQFKIDSEVASGTIITVQYKI